MKRLVDSITPLLNSKDKIARQDVAEIMSNIGTEAVVEPLANIALDDSDDFVRFKAVCGLRTVAEGAGLNGYGIGVLAPEHREFWRKWANYKDTSSSPLVVSKPDQHERSGNIGDINAGRLKLRIDAAELKKYHPFATDQGARHCSSRNGSPRFQWCDAITTVNKTCGGPIRNAGCQRDLRVCRWRSQRIAQS